LERIRGTKKEDDVGLVFNPLWVEALSILSYMEERVGFLATAKKLCLLYFF
jgi:hypothetical protein